MYEMFTTHTAIDLKINYVKFYYSSTNAAGVERIEKMLFFWRGHPVYLFLLKNNLNKLKIDRSNC